MSRHLELVHETSGGRSKALRLQASWPMRAGHAVTTGPPGDATMYVMGGRGLDPSGAALFLNDIWASSDGVAWRLVTQSAPWCV